jgi:translation elongation factor EF-1alpha
MEIKIGEVDDFFAKVSVAAFKVESDFAIGDTIHFKGHTSDVTQMVDSIQVDHKPVQAAKKGDSVGIKTKDRIRKGDTVYKVTP